MHVLEWYGTISMFTFNSPLLCSLQPPRSRTGKKVLVLAQGRCSMMLLYRWQSEVRQVRRA